MAESNRPLESNEANIPSNEELVDSLVSEFNDCLAKEDKPQEKKNGQASSPIESPNNDKANINAEVAGDSKRPGDDDSKKGTENSDSMPSQEEDFVDELALKDLEVNYTEEDCERLRKEAEAHKASGNALFGKQMFRESAMEYTKALRTCPLAFNKDRAILYSNRAAAKMKLGLSESAIEDCTKAVELDERYVKALNRRAQLFEATDKLDEALADYKKILEIDRYHKDALFAARRLPDQINERNEKLKTEMMGRQNNGKAKQPYSLRSQAEV